MRKGKGSKKHTMIQRKIREELIKRGYIVIIEPSFNGRNADVVIQDTRTLKTTIIEIELHKNYSHAIQSINSDLRFANNVIVICGSQTILRSLSNYSAKFHMKDRKRILFVSINRYIDFIRTLFQNKNNNKIHNKTQNKIQIKKEKVCTIVNQDALSSG